MFARVRLCLSAAVAAAVLVTGSAAGAVTASLTTVDFRDRDERDAARQALTDYLSGKVVTNQRIETFEDLDAWNAPGDSGTSNPHNTKVGNFTGIGDTGTGYAAIKGGTAAEVRGDNSMAWGRYDTDLPNGVLGGQWLDSNDMTGIRWTVGGLGKFNTLAFFLNDIEDVGGKFTLTIGDQSFSDLANAGGKRLLNSNLILVLVALSEAVENLTVDLLMHDANGRHINDGFGIDGAMIAHIAPVPLPPAAVLLLAGLAGIAGLRRRPA